VEGGTEKTGKRKGRDAELQKVTYPAAVGIEKSKRKAKELLEESLAALSSFGPSADPLRTIATFIVERAVQP
jgi:geranylgeranyl pyrophosphate synthase